MDWYVTRDGAQEGPYSSDQMQVIVVNGVLRGTDLVWHAGMTEWAPASRTPGLFTPPLPMPEMIADHTATPLPLPAETKLKPVAAAEEDKKEKSKAGWFAKIKSREDALKVVKDASGGFFVVAALTGIASFLLGPALLFDAVMYGLGGFFVRRYYSRTAAVLLLLLSSASTIVTFANKAGADIGGGNNIILALIVTWAAIRATEATFKLHGRFALPNSAASRP